MSERNHSNDLRGASRLAVDATTALTDLVEPLHRRIARGARQGPGARPGSAPVAVLLPTLRTRGR